MLKVDRYHQGHRIAAFKSLISLLSLLILLAFSFPLPNTTYGALSDTPVGWNNFGFAPVTQLGQPIYDYESSSDPTGSSAVQPDRVDISSCSSDGFHPGSQPSAMSAYYDVDGNLNTLNDAYIAFRIRLNASPIENSQNGYDSGHWYVLIDIDNDGWKEFAVDVDGSVNSNKADRVYLLYNDLPQQTVNGRSGAQRAANDTLANDEVDIWYAAGPAAAEYPLSHTRVSTATPACVGGNEFWLDIQLPITAFKDQRGPGGVQKLYPGTPARFFFSTSTSVTDPMAKDWIQGYPTPGFSDSWLPYVTGQVYFPESGMGSEDFVLEVGDSGENTITFKNNTTDNLTDVASTIQYLTLAAANLNPSRAGLSTEASWEIYAPGSPSPRATGTITASLDSSAIYAPYSTSQTVDLYTWAFGRPSPALEQYTDSSQFNDALRVLRAGETLNLTVTVECHNLVGDSRMWFFFEATEYSPTSQLITDLSTIGESQRMNLYYSSIYGSQPAYWWPLHNSYDSYDSDINTGHSFKDAAWTRISTLDVFAKSYKMVHQMPLTSPFDIRLESRQDDNTTTNLGSITFDGTTYSLATDISRTASSYSVQYNPDSGYSFVSWETTGGISVAGPNSASTTATVTAAGTLRAVYQVNVTSYAIHLESRQDDNASTNLGSITFDGTVYTLSDNVTTLAGSYTAQYNPAGGYSFVSWETSGGVSVTDANSASTTATVSGAGTLRAVYQSTPPEIYSIHLESRQSDNTTTNLGSITFDGTAYLLDTDVTKTTGSYGVQYNPDSGYSFVSWETSGSVSVTDPNSSSTTAAVSGAGTLRAVYQANVIFYNIQLESRQDDNSTTNLGSITFDSTVHTLSDNVTTLAGSYTAQYNPSTGYIFVSWEVAGGISVTDPNLSSTTAIVSDNGTLRAVYQTIPQPIYAFHICGTKFNDVNEDGQYDAATEKGINGVSITLLGPDQATTAEVYYVGKFTLPPPDDKNPTQSGENDLIGAYCFNLANLQPGTYTFYIRESVPSGSIATGPTMIGPITLVAGPDGVFENLNNHFGNVELPSPPPPPPLPSPPTPPRPRPSPATTQPSWSNPPSVAVTNLTIQNDGQNQIICVYVYNSGGPGGYNLSLKINGVVESTKTVTLNGGSGGQICWTVNETVPGNYLVEVGRQRAWFTVGGDNAATMALVFGIVGFFIAIMVGLIVIIFREKW